MRALPLRRADARVFVLALALLASACGGGKSGVRPGEDGFPVASTVPADLHLIPDAVPRPEPKSRGGNPADYEVLGEHYFVLGSSAGYRERGRASWYGTKFHGHKTSNGETYDMFGMTAAHKTLPLPTFVRVTHLGNGKSVIVRVNDRGPFHQGRIIDLSYAAATRLDMLGGGSAEVLVEAIDPATYVAAAQKPGPAPEPPRFIEVGSTEDPIDAVALREQAADLGIGAVEIRTEERSGVPLQRVLAGPFRDAASLESAKKRLAAAELQTRTVAE